MKPKFNFSRRDFIKLTSLIPLTWVIQPLVKLPHQVPSLTKPNVIVLVFDAWSADHTPFSGYVRNTIPFLERFAGNMTVYHNHYSAGTFTVPGTASLLTGLHPWSHRAFQLGAGGIAHSHVDNQIFSMLSKSYSTVGFAHNRFADLLLDQAEDFLDVHIPSGSFNVEHSFLFTSPLFKKDVRIAYPSIEDNIFQSGDGTNSSLFLGSFYRLWVLFKRLQETKQFGSDYPDGLPETPELFKLDDLVNGGIQILGNITEPTFAYLHFYPPHELYRPSAEYLNSFNDGWEPVEKPVHPLAIDHYDKATLNATRLLYDQYMASWDAQVSRLFDYLKSSGLLDTSYIIITSDHGELFERGEIGHWTPLIYDPIMHVPLLISSPGQQGRGDIYDFTSSVDVLPTIGYMTGNPKPSWAEGKLLPGYGGTVDPSRSIFTMDAKNNASFSPLTKISLSMTKEHSRLTYYKYPKSGEIFEFYDLSEDPDELTNLFPVKPAASIAMQEELLQKLSDVNKPFE
jgi:arylsulfatase A-like enzyme